MWRSLEQNCRDYHLYIFAFDDESERILIDLCLNHVTVISLNDFEDDRLLSVKPHRTKAEYCWTSTPSVIFYCINRFNLPDCTYIDADLYFFSDPNILIDEMGEQSVLITEHRYTPKYDQSARSGIYCVQFITFKNTWDGMTALTWWRDRCIEWCYDRKEDGKFGDQKYLDDWTSRFRGVHVLQHLGGGVAPWNVQQYQVNAMGKTIQVKQQTESAKLVFFHFHFIKFYSEDKVDLGNYLLSSDVCNVIYLPYLFEILDVEKMLFEKFNFERRIQKYFYKNLVLTLVHKVGRKILGIYNVYLLNKLKKDGTINQS